MSPQSLDSSGWIPDDGNPPRLAGSDSPAVNPHAGAGPPGAADPGAAGPAGAAGCPAVARPCRRGFGECRQHPQVRLLVAAVEASANAIVIADRRGDIVWVNRAFTVLTGYAAEDVLGRNPRFLKSGKQDALFYRHLWETVLAGREWHGGMVNRRKDGSLYIQEMTLTPVLDEHERITHFIAVKEDITERKQVETSLWESVERLRSVVAAATDAIISMDGTGKIVFWNHAAETIFGYSPAEAVGQPATLVIPERFRDDHRRGLHRAVTGEGSRLLGRRTELVGLRADGSEFPMEMSLVRPKTKEGALFTATIRDISERKRAEEAQARLVAIIEAMPLLVATADVDGRLLTLNSAGRQMIGLGEQEDVTDLSLPDLHPEGAREAVVGEGIPSAVRMGVWSGETMVWNVRNEQIPVLQIILAHKHGDGSVAFLSTIAEDMRERMRLEGELRQSQKMDAVGRLAGTVAHDFNNLLMPIMAYGEMLKEKLDPEDPRRRYAEQVVRIADRAAALPRQLLAFSRRQVLQPRVLDLNVVIADMEQMLRPVVAEDIDLTLSPGLALGRVRADPAQIEHAIMNLVVNAADAMPQGGKITIETANVDLDEGYARLHPAVLPGGYVMLTISDTGCGMNKETLARIFEPFFTTKGQGKGTGLGLSTVYGIVKQSGGEIHVYSEVGTGTTFGVYLPRVDESADDSEIAEDTPTLLAAGETVLLVEDEGRVRECIGETLRALGYTVLDAGNGAEALAIGQECSGQIDVLLTDVVMPGMSGRQLAEHLAPAHPEMKVLFMSGYTDDAVVHHGVLAAGVPFLQKPFARVALASKLREVLDRHPD